MKHHSIIEQIKNSGSALSPMLVKLAKYLELNYEESALLNVRDLARKAGVSQTTVTRLAYAYGYTGFTEFQNAIRKEIRENLPFRQHLMGKDDDNLLADMAALEKGIIDEMVQGIEKETFKKAVDMIVKAAKVLVVGTYSGVPFAEHFAHYLSGSKENVHLIREANNLAYNHIQQADKKTVVVTYACPRYPKLTVSMVEALKQAGSHIIAISDSSLSPLAPLADIHFIVPLRFASYSDPYGAVMVLSHALMMGIVVHDRDKYRKAMLTLNDFQIGNDFYVNKKVDLVDLVKI